MRNYVFISLLFTIFIPFLSFANDYTVSEVNLSSQEILQMNSLGIENTEQINPYYKHKKYVIDKCKKEWTYVQWMSPNIPAKSEVYVKNLKVAEVERTNNIEYAISDDCSSYVIATQDSSQFYTNKWYILHNWNKIPYQSDISSMIFLINQNGTHFALLSANLPIILDWKVLESTKMSTTASFSKDWNSFYYVANIDSKKTPFRLDFSKPKTDESSILALESKRTDISKRLTEMSLDLDKLIGTGDNELQIMDTWDKKTFQKLVVSITKVKQKMMKLRTELRLNTNRVSKLKNPSWKQEFLSKSQEIKESIDDQITRASSSILTLKEAINTD